jgi:Na+-driven multidrug efflux pump
VLFAGTSVYVAIMRANGAVIASLLVLAIGLFPELFAAIFILRPWLNVDSLWYGIDLGSAMSLLLVIWLYHKSDWRLKSFMRNPGRADSQQPSDT